MTFADTAKAAFDRIVATDNSKLGVAIIYHVSGGSDLARFAHFNEDVEPLDQIDTRGEYYVRQALLLLSKDATLGVAAPLRADSVTLKSEKWNIESIADGGEMWKIRLHRSQDVSTTNQPITMDRR